MKKKIVFMVINMNVGGTEKALLNMIEEMPKDQYEITILMLEKYGGFLNSIPSEVHVKYLKGYSSIKRVLNEPPKGTAMHLFKKGKPVKALTLFFLHLITTMMKDRSLFFKYLLRHIQEFDQEYDVAVAYAGPMDFISYFVIKKIKAKRKIQWVHFDITKIGFNRHFAAKIYQKFDKIFVVSEEAKDKLNTSLSSLRYKTESFPNLMLPDKIIKMAENDTGFKDPFDGIRILTVGRLSWEKGQDLAIATCAKLKRAGFNVRWYCIGEGKLRSECERLIKEFGLDNDFILLGSSSNPFPFMKQCDLYVQPSRYEGYCLTLLEASCLNKPIIATHVNGVDEQIKNEETGLIVDIDAEEIFKAVKRLISNEGLGMEFKRNLQKCHVKSDINVGRIMKWFASISS